MFFSKVMEGLDFITLYVALSQGQVDSILGGGVAMPQESSQRFGLRTNKEDAVHRSHDFAEWERLYVARSGEDGEVLTHKDVIVCTLRVYAIGYLGTSKRALEKCWFGRSQPSTGGEAEFNIKKS